MAIKKKDLIEALTAPKADPAIAAANLPLDYANYQNVQDLAGAPVSDQVIADNPDIAAVIDPKTQKILNPEDKNPVSVVAPGKGFLQTGSNVRASNPIGQQGLLPDNSTAQHIVNWWRQNFQGKPGVPGKATENPQEEINPPGAVGQQPTTTTTTKSDTGPDILGIIGSTLNDPAVAQLLGRAISGIGKGTDNTTPELMTQNAIIGQVGKRMREDELLARKEQQAQLDRENELKKISSKPQKTNEGPDYWTKQKVKDLQDNLFNNPTWTSDALITQELINKKIGTAKEFKNLSLSDKQRLLARANGQENEYNFIRGQGVGSGQPQSPSNAQPVQAAPNQVPPGMKIQKNKKTGEIRYVPI